MAKFLEKVQYNLGDCISSIDLSKGGAYYAAGLLDESVALWKGEINKENQECSRLEGHSLGVIDIKFNDNENFLAVSSLDSVIRVWDLDQSIKIKEIQCQQMENWKLTFLEDQILCTAGEAGRVILYNTTTGEELQQFSVENSFATALANNQDLLAVCTDSGSIHVVEDVLDKHKLHHLPKLHKKMIRSVQFTGDGSRALTCSDDQEIKLVDLHQMKSIRTFVGHTGNVNAIDMNPIDSKVFVSCSYDGTVKLWDMASNQCIDTFTPFEKKEDNIWDVKFNFDGTLIGVGNQAGVLSFFSRS